MIVALIIVATALVLSWAGFIAANTRAVQRVMPELARLRFVKDYGYRVFELVRGEVSEERAQLARECRAFADAVRVTIATPLKIAPARPHHTLEMREMTSYLLRHFLDSVDLWERAAWLGAVQYESRPTVARAFPVPIGQVPVFFDQIADRLERYPRLVPISKPLEVEVPVGTPFVYLTRGER